jgi:pyruvate,water dikinase
MSQPPLATALVVPFEQLRMTDVEVVGGKNASLGEMISQLAAAACGCPAALPPRRMPSASSCAGGLTERIDQLLTTLDVDDVRALAEAGARSASG